MDRAGRQPALYGEFFTEDFSGGGFLIPADFSGRRIPDSKGFQWKRIPDFSRFYIMKKLCSISEFDEQELFKCHCKRDFSDVKQI